jgi:hypothetical protein
MSGGVGQPCPRLPTPNSPIPPAILDRVHGAPKFISIRPMHGSCDLTHRNISHINYGPENDQDIGMKIGFQTKYEITPHNFVFIPMKRLAIQ